MKISVNGYRLLKIQRLKVSMKLRTWFCKCGSPNKS